MNQQQEIAVNNLLNNLKLTVVEQLELQAISDAQKVCELLNWKEEQLNEFVYNAGRNYLAFYFTGNYDFINKYERNKYFWNWWKLNFNVRNTSYVQSFIELQEQSLTNRLTIFLHLHDCLHLASDLKPDFKLFNKYQEVQNG